MSQSVVIAGCGRMGRERARATRLYGASVSRVFDVDGDRAQAFASEFGGEVVEDELDLMSGSPDALFLCTPPHKRERLEAISVEQGTPWLAEKPLGVDREAPERVLDLLLDAPTVAAAGYMNRSRSGIRYAKDLLAQAEVLGLTMHWLCGRYRVPWWGDEQTSGGPINEQATHFVDLARYLGGDPTEVRSLGTGHPPSSAAISLGFSNRVHGTLLYSCEAPAKHIGFTVMTDAGRLAFDGWDLRLVENTVDGFVQPEGYEEDVFLIETTMFLEAAKRGDPEGVACTYEEAVATQRLVDTIRAAIESARE